MIGWIADHSLELLELVIIYHVIMALYVVFVRPKIPEGVISQCESIDKRLIAVLHRENTDLHIPPKSLGR